MKRKRLLTLVGSICLILVLAALLLPACAKEEAPEAAAPAAPVEVTKWRMQCFMPSGSVTYYCDSVFADRVSEVTGGRLEIELFGPGALFPDVDGIEAAGEGVAEIAHNYTMFYTDTIPEANTLQIPYGITNYVDFYNLLYIRGWLDTMEPLYREQNVFFAAWVSTGIGEQIWSTKPVRTLADFEGLKLRMIGPTATFYDEYLKTSTVAMPGGEIYTALQLGTIDACEYAGGSLDYALGIHEVTSYRILPWWAVATTEFLVNLDAYNALPDDVRAAFDLACGWNELWASTYQHHEDYIALAKMRDDWGMETIYLPDEDVAELRKMARGYWETLRDISPTADRLIQIHIDWATELGLLEE